MIKKLAVILTTYFVLFATLAPRAWSSTNAVFLAAANAGTADGSDCAHAKAASYFNTAGNWSGTPTGTLIGPGTTVHLCATIPIALIAQGNGAAGNPVTILWESGAKLSAPYISTWLTLSGHSYFVLDGGSNGIIENTANGTGLANHSTSDAIQANNAGNIEVKNLTIRNLYVNIAPSDFSIASGNTSCFHSNTPLTGTISIHDNVMHDMNWCLWVEQFAHPSVVVSIYGNQVYNIDHGLTINGNTSDQSYTLTFHDNWIHDFANWDATGGILHHHDGIHIYSGQGIRTFYRNKFSGDMGEDVTGFVFEEETCAGTKGSGVCGSELWSRNLTIQSHNNKINYMWKVGGDASFYGNTWICDDSNLADNMEPFRFNFTTGYYDSIPRHLTFENNTVTGCVTNFEAVNTILDTMDYNVYSNRQAGGNPAWSLNGTNTTSLSTWQSITGKEAHSQVSSASNLDSSGVPLTGASVINAGANLGISNTTLATDILGTLAPTSGPWTVGTYQTTGVAPRPLPPTGITAVPH
jgi:hypothetical protein